MATASVLLVRLVFVLCDERTSEETRTVLATLPRGYLKNMTILAFVTYIISPFLIGCQKMNTGKWRHALIE